MTGASSAIALVPLDPPLPAKAIGPTEVEQRIGTATADAAASIAMGLSCFARAGQMSAGVKERGGAALGEVAELQLDYAGGDSEFAAVATKEGRRVLDSRHRKMLQQHLPPAVVDAAFGDLIHHVLAIAGKVVGIERALRMN